MPHDPEHMSGVLELDELFSGALPVIRGPVEVILYAEGETLDSLPLPTPAIIMADGDHLMDMDGVYVEELVFYKMLASYINQLHEAWKNESLVVKTAFTLEREDDE